MGATAKQNVRSVRATLRRLRASVRAFATGEVGGQAIARACLLLGLLLAINGLNVLNSYVGRDFMTAIEQRDRAEFARQALLYVGLFAALTVAAVLYRFTEERLGLMWREWLTHRVVDRYLERHFYYRLNAAGTLANPDQRIADDVRAFTATTLSLSLIFANGLFTIVAFSGVLWSINRLLFAVTVVYAALGSLLAVAFGRPLVRLNYEQSDREATFRAELVHIRENAELVATWHREPHLGGRLHRDLNALVANFRRIVAVNRNLGYFTTGYNYFAQLIPVLVVAPLFMRGRAEFGVISQSSMAFAHLVGAFSLVVTQFQQLSSYAAVVARLGALVGAAEFEAERGAGGIVFTEDAERLAFEHLTLRTDDGEVLVRELSLDVPRGAFVLVRVPAPVVATALQRAVAGIWQSGEGRLVRPPPGQVLLIADRPYLPPGSLRELIGGGARTAAVSEDEIWSVLRELGAASAVQRVGGLDVERDWDDVLSLEEQRQIGVARVLLAAPRFAVFADLDEGLGSERAQRVLASLADRGTGCLELAQEAVERQRVDVTIAIADDGTWTRTSETQPRS